MNDSKRRELVKALSKKREAEGYSIRQLAEIVGISFSTLARLERGQGAPDTNSIVRILKWLGPEAAALGLDRKHGAFVHFRASKGVQSDTVKALFDLAASVKASLCSSDVDDLNEDDDRNLNEDDRPPPRHPLSKRELESMAEALRKDVGLKDEEPLDPKTLSIDEVAVHEALDFSHTAPHAVHHLRGRGSDSWSAMSIPLDHQFVRWVVILNDTHPHTRQKVTLLEEYWHILLGHELTKVEKIGNAFGRSWEGDAEHDAYYLAAATLLPQRIVRQAIENKTTQSLAEKYGVSQRLVEYRIKRLGLWRQHTGRVVRLHRDPK